MLASVEKVRAGLELLLRERPDGAAEVAVKRYEAQCDLSELGASAAGTADGALYKLGAQVSLHLLELAPEAPVGHAERDGDVCQGAARRDCLEHAHFLIAEYGATALFDPDFD